jgi:hypothetical protein
MDEPERSCGSRRLGQNHPEDFREHYGASHPTFALSECSSLSCGAIQEPDGGLSVWNTGKILCHNRRNRQSQQTTRFWCILQPGSNRHSQRHHCHTRDPQMVEFVTIVTVVTVENPTSPMRFCQVRMQPVRNHVSASLTSPKRTCQPLNTMKTKKLMQILTR